MFCDNILLLKELKFVKKWGKKMRKKDPDSLNKREKAILKFIEKQIKVNG